MTDDTANFVRGLLLDTLVVYKEHSHETFVEGCVRCELSRTEAEEVDEEACEWCGGSGVVTFCPSWPDKCRGCETAMCSDCNGTGRTPE